MARSLHLRDIPSDPKESVEQSANQVCWKQQNRLDLLQCRKIQIPYGKDMQSQLFISQTSSSEKERINSFPLQDHQNNKTTTISVHSNLHHSRKLSLSLKKQPSSSTTNKIQVNQQQQQPSSSPFKSTQPMPEPSSSPNKTLVNQQQQQQLSFPPPSSTQPKPEPSSSPNKTLVNQQQLQQPNSSPPSSTQPKPESNSSSAPNRIQVNQQQQQPNSTRSKTKQWQQQPSSSSSSRTSTQAKPEQQPNIFSLFGTQIKQQQPFATYSSKLQQSLTSSSSSESSLSGTQLKPEEQPSSYNGPEKQPSSGTSFSGTQIKQQQQQQQPESLLLDGVHEFQTKSDTKDVKQNTKQLLPLNCNPFSDCSTGKQAKELAIPTQVTDESTILIESPPCSPLAPPFSPIVSEETEHEEPIITICVPIQQVITHSHLPPAVSALFPANYTYVFEDFTQLDSHRVAFDTKFLVNVKTETEAKQWISKFEHITDTTYRITKGTKTIGKRILYKIVRHCQHKRKKSNKPTKKDRTKDITQRDKKTDCVATLVLRVHNRSNSKSHICVSHPCEIHLLWQHNHSIHSAHALTFKRGYKKEIL